MEGFDHGEDKTSVRNDGQQPHTAIITCRTPCYHVPCQGENAKAWALPKEPIRQGQRTETFTGTAGWPTRMLPRAPSPPSPALRRADPGAEASAQRAWLDRSQSLSRLPGPLSSIGVEQQRVTLCRPGHSEEPTQTALVLAAWYPRCP